MRMILRWSPRQVARAVVFAAALAACDRAWGQREPPAREELETEDESRVLYGAKIETTDQAGWLPRSALIVQGFTPVSGPSNKSTLMVGEACGWRFANGWE
jgi:hypothetical protein